MLNTLLSKLIVVNVKTGKPSYVLTAFMVGMAVVNIKLILSGITFKNTTIGPFSGTEYAAAIVALTSLYVSNKHINNINSSKIDSKIEEKE